MLCAIAFVVAREIIWPRPLVCGERPISVRARQSAGQLAVAVLIYMADHDERVFLGDIAALRPYLKNDLLLTSPETKRPFAFNRNLYGVSFAKATNMDRLVMVYDGADQKLQLTKGSAAVGLAEGRGKRVSRSDAIDWLPRW